MYIQTLIAIGEVVLVPVLTFLTMWVQNSFKKGERQEKREEGFIQGMIKDIEDLKKEIREMRIELKNRDAEYVKLYQEYTTLKAKHEVLQVDHDLLKRNYDATVDELLTLKDTIKKDRENTASLASSTAKTVS